MLNLLKNKMKPLASLLLIAQMVMHVGIPVLLLAPVLVPTHAHADTWGSAGPEGQSASTGTIVGALKNIWSKTKNAASDAAAGAADFVFGNILKAIAWLIFQAAGAFFQSMTLLLDMSIDKTIDSSMYKGLSVIQVGWTAIRDMTNMFFIFVLLYISILTILGMAGSQTKSWVAHLIIAALLINFSLFATQVVVDVGNILTMGFWSNINTTINGNPSGGFASVILEGLKLQTSFNVTGLSNFDTAKVYLGGAVLMFIAGYVVLSGAIMMIIRTVTLIIVMITSPFAFLGFALPKGGGFAQKWLDKLIGATFVAPVFVMMLYLNMIIIRTTDIVNLGNAGGSQFGELLQGDVSNFSILYNFAVIIILLLSSLTVANSISNGVGAGASNFAKKALGYGGGAGVAVMGITGGMAGRQLGGSAGRLLQNNKKIEEWSKSKNWMARNLATTAKRTGSVMAKGSWDVRNSGVVGAINKGLGVAHTGVTIGGPLQAGSKKSYATHGGLVGGALVAGTTAAVRAIPGGKNVVDQEKLIYRGTENEKKIIEKAKEIHPFNPEAREAYMKDRGVDLSHIRNKATSNELKRDIDKANANATLKKSTEIEKDIAEGKLSRDSERAKIEGKEIGIAVKEAMLKLTTSEKAELAASNKDNVHYINNLDKGDYGMIHRAELEGKTNGVLKDITEKIMKGENTKLQDYIVNPENQNRLTMIDQDKIRSSDELMANYNRQIDRIHDKRKAYEEALKEQVIREKTASDKNIDDKILSAFDVK